METNNPLAYEDLSQQIPGQELSTLLKVSNALASSLDLGEVLQIAIESTTKLIGLETGAIYTLNDDILVLGATTPPLPPNFPNELRLANLSDHPHIKKAITTKNPVWMSDSRDTQLSPAEKIVVESRQLLSILYFPLLLKDDAIGAFIVGTTQEIRQFSEKELELCGVLSCQVALAVANAQLFESTQEAVANLTRAYHETLEAWSRVLDLRDHVTDEHTHRVADMVVALAKKIGFAGTELGHIRRGALLHDIGKMGIPDSILQKPDVLNNDEWEIMMKHPELAYQLLSQIEYLVPAIDIPYCHHEKWDGTGYPRGLKGEEIPMVARIFTVVDVYDALTSDRPYRRAWEKEKALAYVREQSGKHFCPDSTRAFFEMVGSDL